jgi:gamma-glutamyltranspeptidase
MVTSPHHLASQAGLDVLKDGGNAIEAAVAVAACLAVVYPHMTGIGGDGFWIVAEPDGRVRGVDACGRAAAAADLSLYEGHDAIPSRGPLAANTVAGTISGWQAALGLAPGGPAALPPAARCDPSCRGRRARHAQLRRNTGRQERRTGAG